MRRAIALLLWCTAGGAPACAQKSKSSREDAVRDLPLHIIHPSAGATATIAIVLSGDGGWADIDKQLARRLSARGLGVIGVDSRAYFAHERTPDETARDIGRLLANFAAEWSAQHTVIIGYARGANVAPFIANRLPLEQREMISLVALLGPSERASFHFRWLDLLNDSSSPSDTPILPELERLRGTPVLCVFGRDEKESLCRLADTTAVHVDARRGRRHFDGNYDAIVAEIVRLTR